MEINKFILTESSEFPQPYNTRKKVIKSNLKDFIKQSKFKWLKDENFGFDYVLYGADKHSLAVCSILQSNDWINLNHQSRVSNSVRKILLLIIESQQQLIIYAVSYGKRSELLNRIFDQL